MARKNILLVALTSFVVILLLVALVRYLFPRSIMGFADMSCYGVACQEGEFCQSGSCKKIYPQETNNYYDEGVEGFQDSCPPGTKKNEKGDCQATEGFLDSKMADSIGIGIGVGGAIGLILLGATYYYYNIYIPSIRTQAIINSIKPSPSFGGRRR
jgi:hypothetical protein